MRRFSGEPFLIRHPRAANEGIRDYPIYSIPDAALILAMPLRTLRSWVYDKPIFKVSGNEELQRLLSFKDLAQFYFLKFVRKHAHLSDHEARVLLQYAKEVTASEYPLLHESIHVTPSHVRWEQVSEEDGSKRVLELLRPRGQYVFHEVVNMFSTRVDRDARGVMRRLYPWRLWRNGDKRRPVSVDPYVMSGRLVLTGTRIPASIVAARIKQGESVRGVARDYGVSQRLISESLRHLQIAIRKAA